MRYFTIFILSFFLSIAMAVGKEMPFSESAKELLNIEYLSSQDIDKMNAFVSRMDRKEITFKKKRNFINYLYNQVYKDIFLSYEQLTSFEDLVSKGKYNCLTGSIFFALLLERYDVEYRVIETNYHMFILIEDEGKEYLLESTDPINGFETDPFVVAKRLAEYKAKNSESAKNSIPFRFDLFNNVDLSQLEGLLAYNNSVLAFNQREFFLAVDHLFNASLSYTSPRIIEMAKIIEVCLYELPADNIYLEKLAKIKQRESPLYASN